MPKVEHADVDWSRGAIYLLHSNVTATCHEGYLAAGDVPSLSVGCTRDGWETGWCYAACTAAPPTPGEHIIKGAHNHSGVGVFVRYDCESGFFLKKPGVGLARLFDIIKRVI